MKTSEILRDIKMTKNEEGHYVSGRITVKKIGINYWVECEGNPVKKMCLSSREAFAYAAALHYGLKKREMEVLYGFSRFVR